MGRALLASFVAMFVSARVTQGVSFPSTTLGIGSNAAQRVDGLFAKPSGPERFPAIVLLHTCGGVLPHVSEDWPAFLSKNGFATLTVDTFGSRNAGRCPEARRFGGVTMWQDAYGALDYLAGRPDIIPDRIGVMGFSLGGMAIESFATSGIKSPAGRTFRAAIVAYGQCNIAHEPSFPVLEIIGGRDKNARNCPGEFNDNMGVTNRSVPRVWVDIIPGATHAFDNTNLQTMRMVSGGHQAIYNQDSTMKAREAARKFFVEHLAR